MKRAWILAVAFLVGGAAQSAFAQDFEYHGYMRSGMGFSRGGTDQVCFRAPGTEGASGKFRLGNECETYIEADFVKNTLLGKTKSEPSFNTNFRLAAVSQGHRDWEPTDTQVDGTSTAGPELSQAFTLSLREAYVQGVNVIGMAKPWVGKRFYRRHDIHILDYYTLDNSGPGAGLEDIGMGFANLHLALTRNIPAGITDGPAQTNTDIRFSDIHVGSGKLETAIIYGTAGKRGHESGDEKWEPISGTQLAVFHTLDVLGGYNKVTFQYGTGIFGATGDVGTATAAPTTSGSSNLSDFGAWGSQNIAKGADDQVDARKSSKTMRLAEELLAQFSKDLATNFVLLYQNADFGGLENAAGDKIPNKVETTLGVRPILAFSETTAVALEAGTTKVDNALFDGKDYKAATLNKLTLAPQITAGRGFWARPTLRVFATYASWNDDSKGGVGGDVYSGSTNGFSTGAQLEAWW